MFTTKPFRLFKYTSAILLSLTLLLHPAVRSAGADLLVAAVPAAEASGTSGSGGGVDMYARCAAIYTVLTTLSTAIAAGEAHLVWCTVNPEGAGCEDVDAIREALEALQEQFDRVWDRARSLHCVE